MEKTRKRKERAASGDQVSQKEEIGEAVAVPSTPSARSGQSAELDSGSGDTPYGAKETKQAAATEMSQEQAAPQGSASLKDAVLQRCMRIPSFRKLVISRLIKKLE